MQSTFFFLILFFSFFCHAENRTTVNIPESSPELNSILNNLHKSSILRSQFKQFRHLKILSKPIISEGKLNYFSGKGIIWEIEKPINSKIIISQNKITEINHNQTVSSRPNNGGIYTLLDALFNGNSKVLSQNFTISYQGSAKNWHLELTPKSAPMNKIFNTIEIQGKKHINRITLNDVNSDSTIITLSTTDTKPQTMTATEESYFAL